MRRMWVALALTVVLLACGRESNPVVITVGDEAIHADEFRYLFRQEAAADTSLLRDVAGRMRYAESLAEELVYEQLFREKEADLDPSRLDRVQDFKERRMVELLREIEYGDARKVSDAELAAAYARQGTRRHVRRIIVESQQKANEIRRAVMEGGLFDRVAQQVSLDERTRPIGGDLGWLSYSDVPPLERDEVWATPVGEVSAPISGGAVWAVYQILEEDPNLSRGTLEEERETLELGIAMRKNATAIERYRRDLFERSNFRLDPAQLAWMTIHLREKTQGAVRGTDVMEAPTTEEKDGYLLSRGQIPWTGPPVLPADTSRVIATYDPDGKVQPLLVFDQLLSSPIPTWPTFEKSEDVEKLVRELVLERLEQAEAYRRGLDQAPEVLFELRQREREVERRQLVRNQLRNPNIPDRDEIYAEYERRLDEFTSPEARRFVAFNATTEAAAARAAELMRAGVPMAEVVAQFGPEDNVQATGDSGTPPMTKGQSAALDHVLFALGLGDVSDPIPVGDTFTVGKVIEILPAEVEPFEDVRVDLQVRMVDERVEPLEKEMLAKARETYPVHIDVAAIRKIDLDGK
ncbi:MAG: peptidyl-prolyl cis-trans isomerase [Candidatus Eisenbacteria bacterium]|uniref:Peptidyl-prolyl cis-trans isomerase n=1 Tax=Eiseniibacteriota bacterium TaxID=2212470 RepID=A0A956NDF0_UNCEI|nr:peptidyl-prolyl cis-trans isomerase [Candidatus Eisenbacteria bacterium]